MNLATVSDWNDHQLSLPFEKGENKKMILTSIPMPPSSNNIYSTYVDNKSIKRVKSSHFVKWQKDFADWCMIHFSDLSAVRTQLLEKLPGKVLEIHTEFSFHYKNILTLKGLPKRNDTSNRLKCIHDAAAEVLHIDDCYFWDGTFSKKIIYDEAIKETCSIQLKIIDIPTEGYGLT